MDTFLDITSLRSIPSLRGKPPTITAMFTSLQASATSVVAITPALEGKLCHKEPLPQRRRWQVNLFDLIEKINFTLQFGILLQLPRFKQPSTKIWPSIELSSNSTWLLVGGWLFYIQCLPLWGTFGACLEVVWRFEQRTFYIGSWRVKLILACQEVLKWIWPSMN